VILIAPPSPQADREISSDRPGSWTIGDAHDGQVVALLPAAEHHRGRGHTATDSFGVERTFLVSRKRTASC
jgi:hypothetical protein